MPIKLYSQRSPDFKMGSTNSVALAVPKQCPKTYSGTLPNLGYKLGAKERKKGEIHRAILFVFFDITYESKSFRRNII